MMKNIAQFFQKFPTEDACMDHLFQVRYGKDYVCPSCKKPGKFYRIQGRKSYSCQWCRHQEYPMVGTPFEKSRTDLRLWFYAIYMFTTSRHGVAAKELERVLGVTYKCAWRMAHEIRKHMAIVDGDPPLSGDVEVDETFVGGYKPGRKGPSTGKTIILGMLQRGGDVMTKVVPDLKRRSLQEPVVKNVKKGSTIHSDEALAYDGLEYRGYTHKKVKHRKKQYVSGNSHVNSLEGYWSRFINSVKGTHVWVSPQHMQKYTGEFEYRFNSRHHPEKMFPELISSFLPLKKG